MTSPSSVVFLCAAQLLLYSQIATAQPVAVRQPEGVVHGFLLLRSLEGTILAEGELNQTSAGNRVTSRLTFHFKDGSLHEETAVYTQRPRFKVINTHLVQKGPSFPKPMDFVVDAARGTATVRYQDDDGKPKVESEHLKLQPDLANGLMMTVVKNLDPKIKETTVSMVAATPKPRLVKVVISPEGEDSFIVGGNTHKATRYVLKPELGGITGFIAPIIGKQPPDALIWILRGDAPAFLKSESTFYVGGPVWRIELTSPAWPAPGK
jgi:hypothetical protein